MGILARENEEHLLQLKDLRSFSLMRIKIILGIILHKMWKNIDEYIYKNIF